MTIRLGLSAFLLGLVVSMAALADPLPTTAPESVGLSSSRLQRITETLKADVAAGTIPGAVLLISRNGKIAYFEAMGSLDPEKKTPMTKDGIFRIYSMSKPITTVRCDDAVRGGQAGAERSGRQVHPRLQGREGRRGESRAPTASRPWSWSRLSGR